MSNAQAPTLTPAELMRRYRVLEGRHFGDVLRAIAGACSMSDSDLAARTGFSRATVNAKKNGTKPIRIEEVDRWAAAVGVPEGVFYEETVADAIRAAAKYLEWDPAAGALRGVHETAQYSPTRRTPGRLATAA